MHTGLKSEFSQQSLISKCLLNSAILWNEIMLFGVKANWISHDALPGRKLCQGSDGAKRSVNNLPSPLKLELYWGVVIVYLLCICLSVHCLLWKALLSVECCRQTLEVWFWRVRERSDWGIIKKITRSSWSWIPRPCLTEPSGLDTHFEIMSRCRFSRLSVKWQHEDYIYGAVVAKSFWSTWQCPQTTCVT